MLCEKNSFINFQHNLEVIFLQIKLNLYIYVKQLNYSYKTVRLSESLGSRFIVLSHRTLQCEHLEEENMSLALLFNEMGHTQN